MSERMYYWCPQCEQYVATYGDVPQHTYGVPFATHPLKFVEHTDALGSTCGNSNADVHKKEHVVRGRRR
jgi:hypothetical protein